jgi:hypothetical protein
MGCYLTFDRQDDEGSEERRDAGAVEQQGDDTDSGEQSRSRHRFQL